MTTFTAELAGVPVQVKCRFEENRDFLADYLTDREPKAAVEPSEEDMRRMRLEMDRMAERQGFRYERVADSYLENNALHRLIVQALLPFGVLLLHGSALCMDGEAVIFTAPSGTGKSTQARLWREAFGDRVGMINDDKPLLKLSGDRVTVHGSPWDGKHRLSRNVSAPLKAVIRVRRSAENRIAPLTRDEAFLLMTRHSWMPEDPEEAKRTLALRQEMLDRAAFYGLECNMSPEAAETAYRGVFGC